MMKPCPICKRSRKAILKPDGKVVILPHTIDGSDPKPGFNCGQGKR